MNCADDRTNPSGRSFPFPLHEPVEGLVGQARRAMFPGMKRIVVIGGGAIGSAVAYWLTADPAAFAGEVVVVERDPTYARASSALSASSIRQQFSTPVNVEIGRFGVGFLRGLGETLAVHGERPDIGLKEPGYLFLATRAGLP